MDGCLRSRSNYGLSLIQRADEGVVFGSCSEEPELSVGIVVPATVKIELRQRGAVELVAVSILDRGDRIVRPVRDFFKENCREDNPDSCFAVFGVSEGDPVRRIVGLGRARGCNRTLVVATMQNRLAGNILMSVNYPRHIQIIPR